MNLGPKDSIMATDSTYTHETVADLLDQLHVPPERILLRPPPGEATEKDLLKNPRLCELIDGVLVEKAMGWYESRMGAVLIFLWGSFLEKHPLGIVVGESGYMRVNPEQVRIPDVAFYSWDHFPNKILPMGQILDIVPDLAVEIWSPTNTTKEMHRKRGEYFAGGAKLVWEVFPQQRIVKVYTAPDKETTLDENGVLDGGPVLPGFTLAVREWFERAGKRG
jgi:Uma2 family endonuclease